MFRTTYSFDADATTYSPEGRIRQVDNAMKAVGQGMATVGIRSRTHALVACLMHSPSQFSSHQQKIFKIDDHIGVAICGLTADGRGLCKMLRGKCLDHRFGFGTGVPVVDLAEHVALRSQAKTQSPGKRPYGVGLLLVGSGRDGVRLFETCPSGLFWEYNAQAIGRRAQAGKTYLEQHLREFDDAGRDDLIRHALRALRDCRTKDASPPEIAAAGIVGIDEPFVVLQDDELQPYEEP
jgi:20S proteasome subunit alpha 6